MTDNALAFCIAFAKDENTTVYREQAKLMLESLITFGGWKGRIAVFTNLRDRPLKKELPEFITDRVQEIIIPFNDWSTGKEGKLPSARFRIEAWKHFPSWWKAPTDVLYLDTDCIVRRPLAGMMAELEVSQADIMGATVANRNMARAKWFNGHITPDLEQAAAGLPPVQSGTILFRGRTFQETCEKWAELDRYPARPGVHPNLVTDQSSHNLLHLLSRLGRIKTRSARLSVSAVACPHVGQRKTLGHRAVNTADIWHYWHLFTQEDRVVAMRSELDRLKRTAHPAPDGLLGRWLHEKPKEKIRNHWSFSPDGLVCVDDPAICGRWEWEEDENEVLIDWLWGWERVRWSHAHAAGEPWRFSGTSFRNGEFTLTKV